MSLGDPAKGIPHRIHCMVYPLGNEVNIYPTERDKEHDVQKVPAGIRYVSFQECTVYISVAYMRYKSLLHNHLCI